ncbi:MAG: PCMD domain-containing protein, partial [Bacteroidales bacterium]|nr:PCMD domain-containing protein [Bacteroidales bacterium]
MKKLVLLLILTIYFTQLVFTQDIQNSGFEDWTNQVLFEEPDQFTSSNILSYPSIGEPNVTKTTDAYSGNYAVRLETVAVDEESLTGAIFIGEPGDEAVIGGVPFTERPDSIKGYAKYNVPAGDTAYVLALFKKLGIPLGICLVPFVGEQTEYQQFSMAVQWLNPILSPDTLATGVLSSSMFSEPIPGSWIIVDSIHFVGASTPYPNGSFEDWNTFSSEEPDNWFTSNIFTLLAGEASVTKSEDSYEGNFAVRIESTLTMWDDTLGLVTNGTFGDDGPMGGMPVDNIPDVLSGYYKYTPVGPDTALAAIALYHYNETTGMTETLEENLIKLPAAEDYTYFEIEV